MENNIANTEKNTQRPNIYITTLILAAGIGIVLGCSRLYSSVIEPRLGFEVPELVSNILTMMIVPYVIGLALCLLLYKLLPAADKSGIAAEKLGAANFVKGTVIQTGLGMILAIPLNIAHMIFTGEPSVAENDFGSLFMAFVLLIFAPAVEEFLFRKLAIDRLRRFGKYPAVLISAVMFAIPHIFSQSLAAFGMTLAAGMVWGYVYYKTNDLLPCVLMHSLFNIINGYAANFLTTNGVPLKAVYVLIYVLAMPVAAAALLIIDRKRIFLSH